MWNAEFWKAVVERMVRAGVSAVLALWVVGDGVMSAWDVDWEEAGGLFLGAALVSLLLSLSGNACLDKHLTAYLTDGRVPRGPGETDATCKKLADPKPLKNKAASASSRGSTLHGLLGFRG